MKLTCSCRLWWMVAVAAVMTLYPVGAAVPSWWVARNVFKAGDVPADDFAGINRGQVKNLMRAAIDEMNASLPGGAGPTLNGLLASWRSGTGGADDFAAANIGQVKAMAKLLRTRLAEVGITAPPVGTTSTDDDDDYALANIGQAKAAFAFPILDPQGDNDDDGLTNGQEVALGTNINLADTDGDGVDDGEEHASHTDGTDAGSNVEALVGLRVFTQLEADL